MPLPRSTDDANHLPSLRRLLLARWVVLAGTGLIALITDRWLNIPLPLLPLSLILGIAALFNTGMQRRLVRSENVSTGELFSQLLFDLVILGALLFFSGGATNPLVFLLLPPVAIAALTLPGRHVLGIAAIAITLYSLLMLHYLPLPLPDASRAARLHLIGMWLTFAISTLMIAWFVVRMTRLIRERDAELAAAREQALRDERVMAMGTLAAGAAHELGTPLATMALLAGELATDSRLPPEVNEDIALLRQQIGVCKQIITGLSRRAGAERLENAPHQAVDQWLENLRQHWHAARPQAQSTLTIAGKYPAPSRLADPRLEQALLNLLNNAANASPSDVSITLSWTAEKLVIEICDAGPGFPPSVLSQGGRTGFPAHAGGSGVGLLLTHSAIEQMGGRLWLDNPAQGGARARIELPCESPKNAV